MALSCRVSFLIKFIMNANVFFLFQPLFSFLYKDRFPVDGWKVYDPVSEYKRQVTGPTDPTVSYSFTKFMLEMLLKGDNKNVVFSCFFTSNFVTFAIMKQRQSWCLGGETGCLLSGSPKRELDHQQDEQRL